MLKSKVVDFQTIKNEQNKSAKTKEDTISEQPNQEWLIDAKIKWKLEYIRIIENIAKCSIENLELMNSTVLTDKEKEIYIMAFTNGFLDCAKMSGNTINQLNNN